MSYLCFSTLSSLENIYGRLLCLGRHKETWNVINVYKYVKGGCKEDRDRLFPVAPRQETMGTKSNTGDSSGNTYLVSG